MLCISHKDGKIFLGRLNLNLEIGINQYEQIAEIDVNLGYLRPCHVDFQGMDLFIFGNQIYRPGLFSKYRLILKF